MKTIASNSYDQTLNAYINTLYGYTFNISNLSTYTVYNDSILVAKPTILNHFLPFFKSYSIKMKIDEKYYQKPNLFALDYYGSSELEWLVLYVSGISHPIDFNHSIIDVLPVSMLNDLNKLVTLYKKEVQESRNKPEAYTSSTIDLTRQVGFIEERYIYKNDKNLFDKLLTSSSKNRLNFVTTGHVKPDPISNPTTTTRTIINSGGVGSTNRFLESVLSSD
jgi:hypothetical protein